MPAGGGYTAEMLLADADIALAAAAVTATVVGRGLGAYVALMLAGRAAHQVRGAVLCDGPGLAGGGPTGPTSRASSRSRPRAAAPDPYALFELSRDLRPPDYATLFVRLAVEHSGLDEPITVAAHASARRGWRRSSTRSAWPSAASRPRSTAMRPRTRRLQT